MDLTQTREALLLRSNWFLELYSFGPRNTHQPALSLLPNLPLVLKHQQLNMAIHRSPGLDSPSMSAEAFYFESIEGPTTSLSDINFDAPVNSIINFPELWIEWMQTENGLSI
jgi:hypothetical protein